MTETERKGQFLPHSMHSGYGGQLPASAHALNHILSRGTVAENVAMLTGFLCEAMKFRHEEAMLEGFKWLCRAWERFDTHVEMRAAQGISHEAFGGISRTPAGVPVGDVPPAWTVEQFKMNKLDRLIDLYALTPGSEGCLMLKVAIIQMAVREFLISDRTEIARKAFSFLLAMGYSRGRGYRFDHPYSDVRERLADRCVTKAERDALENAVRESMGSWKLADIEAWYVEWSGFRFIHADLLNVFSVVWGRRGGVALMDGSLADRALLKPFDRPNRSSAALALLMQAEEDIVSFDVLLNRLMECLKPGSAIDMKYDAVGKCEELYGVVTMTPASLEDVLIDIHLPDDISEDFGRDLVARARRHIEAWKLCDGRGITIHLKAWNASGEIKLDFRG